MATETSALFAQYEAEYCSKSTELSRKIQTLATVPAELRQGKSKELDGDVRQAEQIIQRLDMEARSFSPDRSRAALQKVKEFRADLAKLREDASRAAASGAGAGGADSRAELGLGDDFYQTSAGQRERLLTATDRLNKTSDRIQQGRQQLLETEATGQAVLAELQRQRATIQHAAQQTAEIDASVASSEGILKRMGRWWNF